MDADWILSHRGSVTWMFYGLNVVLVIVMLRAAVTSLKLWFGSKRIAKKLAKEGPLWEAYKKLAPDSNREYWIQKWEKDARNAACKAAFYFAVAMMMVILVPANARVIMNILTTG